MTIIYIICHNNHAYVRHTIDQIRRINPSYAENIQIIDNGSTSPQTARYLKDSGCPIIRTENERPGALIERVSDGHTPFCITDPDLGFNPNLPSDFINVLISISEEFKSFKVGFALRIDDFEDAMYHDVYAGGKTIYDWEKQFWESPVENAQYKLYCGNIDTTFCLVHPAFQHTWHLRVAGDFCALHLPWYTHNPLLNAHEIYSIYSGTAFSTMSPIILRRLEEQYCVIRKNDEFILIASHDDNPNLGFWRNTYPGWEPYTFQVLDRYLDPTKDFLDIGGWVGTTCIYASYNSSHVYVVEADRQSLQDLRLHCNNNARNITIIDRAIYPIDGVRVGYGKNLYSTSQIHSGEYLVDTVSIRGLSDRFGVDFSRLSLIKVDIEGGEEHILSDLDTIKRSHRIPVYVSFHYTLWQDPDLDRFPFLTDRQKEVIRHDPFTSILME